MAFDPTDPSQWTPLGVLAVLAFQALNLRKNGVNMQEIAKKVFEHAEAQKERAVFKQRLSSLELTMKQHIEDEGPRWDALEEKVDELCGRPR